MSWLDFFQTTQTLKHTFGRGINAAISSKEEELFIQSSEAFEKKEIIKAYKLFFQSLVNYTDKSSNENITYYITDNSLVFTIFQGCAKITGEVTEKSLSAEAILIKKKELNIALKRYILDRNYQFTYAYYATDDKYVKLKLYSDNITMSPQKVFFPLREIALNADFDKEYISNKFPKISLEDINHVKTLAVNESKLKYQYMHRWIDDLQNKIIHLPSNDNSAMQAFLYLNLLFQIDYLLVPKYKISQQLATKILDYFSQKENNIESKNEEIQEYVQDLKKINYKEFNQNFYNANYTFNPTEKSSYEDIINFINESLTKIRWYKNNRYYHIIPTIYKYISFYTLYNYGLNPALREFFQLIVEIQNTDFFHDLDYKMLYNPQTDEFNKKTIISRVDNTIEHYKDRYKSLESFAQSLNFNSENELYNSFYIEIQNLNFEEI